MKDQAFSGAQITMRDGNFYAKSENALLQNVVAEFAKGRNLIGAIDDITYRRSANGTGGVGGHIRHNLDFANCFLNGLAIKQIDYNRRERDMLVETDRSYAIEKIDFAVLRLTNLTDEILQRLVFVRSEIDHDTWLASSVMRELEFLHSHTVHHHALIAEKLAGCGITVAENFGVAPSTLKFWSNNSF